MATPQFTQAEFKSQINGALHGKFAQCQDTTVVMNRAVRYALGDFDWRSTKRSSQLSPNMFADVFDYTCPSDLKGNKIIDLKKQVNRSAMERFILVDETDFDRTKNISRHRIAILDDDFSRILKIDGVEGSSTRTLHSCESLTANGAWAATADASNLTLDNDNYITGGGSLNFDMAAGATTGYIENSTMDVVDLTDYQDKGSVFVWVFIPDYSDAEADTVTNFILRIGNDTSNYVSRTVTVNNEGLTFHDGWNLLRFDLNGATASAGTVAWATVDYLRLTVTKSTDLAADTDWRVDNFVAKIGAIYDVVYYSKFGWTTTAGVYIEESTTTTDLIIADTDEIEILAFKAAEIAAQELKEKDEVAYFKGEYENSKLKYLSHTPSEALKVTRRYGPLPRLRRY